MSNNTVVISINSSWNIVNFRKGLISALRENGYRVVALAPEDGHSRLLAGLGAEFHPITIDRQGASIARDAVLLRDYVRALRRIRPAVFLGYTAKPNVYGSLASHLLGIPVINNVAGLGTAFIKEGPLTRIVSGLYRLAFRRSATVFFQNEDDQRMFVQRRLVAADKAKLLPGSGINLGDFTPRQRAAEPGEFTFLMVARLLWDKGVREYVEAAREVKRRHPHARFQILGFLDVPNRTAVSRSDVDEWVREGIIDYLGHSDDVRPFVAAADCIVLPSYREGLPRVLLEGAAMARPLIATDVPGCRHVVQEGLNGLLCSVRDSRSLAQAMTRMITMDPEERKAMGAAGRRRVEAEFDEQIAVARYLSAIREAVGSA
jgi:glycosyltransferase involved in cell wall biosynthesis